MQPAIVEQPELRAACLRHTGPYAQIGQTFARLAPIAGADGLARPGARLIGIYHDDPATVAPSALRSNAGILLDPSSRVPSALTEVILPVGRYLSLRHLGSYDTLPASWASMATALAEHGLRRRAGPSYEIYLNTPQDTRPQDLITEI